MGGEYPSGHEFNFFGHNITAAADVVNTWPGRVTFIGFELGRDVYSGGQLMVDGPESDPVNAAYRWYKSVDRFPLSPARLTRCPAAGMMYQGSRGTHSRCSTPSRDWETSSSMATAVAITMYFLTAATHGRQKVMAMRDSIGI